VCVNSVNLRQIPQSTYLTLSLAQSSSKNNLGPTLEYAPSASEILSNVVDEDSGSMTF
jgi:hypothetical protein